MTITLATGTPTERPAELNSAVPYPATVAAGALAVLVGSAKGGARTPNQVGWTTDVSISCIGNTNPPNLFMAHRYCDGSEGGTSFTVLNHSNTASEWIIYVLTGVDAVTPLDVTPQSVDASAGSNNTPVPSSTVVTTAAAGIYGAALNSTVATSTAPTSWTEDADRSAQTASFTACHILNLPQGATGTIQNLWSASARSVGGVLIIRPAGTPASGTASLSLSGSAVTKSAMTSTANLSLSGSATGSAPAIATASLSLSGSEAASAGATATANLGLSGSEAASASAAATALLALSATAVGVGGASATAHLDLSGSIVGAAGFAGTAQLDLSGSAAVIAGTGGLGLLLLNATAAIDAMLASTASLELSASAVLVRGYEEFTLLLTEGTDRWQLRESPDRWDVDDGVDRWLITTTPEGPMPQEIHMLEGFPEFTFPTTITELTGKDISDVVIHMALWPDNINPPPVGDPAWVLPARDVPQTDHSIRVVQLAVGTSYNPAAGKYYIWTYMLDGLEKPPRKGAMVIIK